MKNRKLIRKFAKDHGIKVIGPLYLLVDHSAMRTKKWLWYRDLAGNTFLILPWCDYVCQMYNLKKNINIKNNG